MSIGVSINNGSLVDRTGLLNLGGNPVSFTLTIGQRGTANVEFIIAAGSSYASAIGEQVFIYDESAVCVFAGTIDTIDIAWLSNSGTHIERLTVVSLEQCFDALLIDPPRSFFGDSAGDIFATIRTDYCAAVPVGYGAIDSGPVVDSLICNFSRVSEVFSNLATIAGFAWWIKPSNQKIYFQLPATASPFTLTEANIIWDSINWGKTRADFRNRQTERVSFEAFVPEYSLFAGDGATQTFTLPHYVDSITRADITRATRATVTGTFTGQPSAGDTITLGDSVFTFRASLNNQVIQEVLIGASTAASLQNLVDAINANPSVRGVSFSRPTWAHDSCIADAPSGLTFVARAAFPGTVGDGHESTDTSANFSWSAASTSGGVDGSFTTLKVGVAGGSDTGKDLYYTPGDTAVAVFPAPAVGTSLLVGYYRIGGDCITVEDTALVTARAAIEGGTGLYHQLNEDTQQKDAGAALQAAQKTLTAYSTLPVTFAFTTDTAGLIPGQVLTITLTLPTGAGALVNGTWLVQEVNGAYFIDAAGEYFRYTVSVISANATTTLQFWQNLTGGGGGSGGGSISGGGGSTGGGTSTGSTSAGAFGYQTVTPSSGIATIDLLNGVYANFRVTLTGTAVTISAPTSTGGTITAGQKLWLHLRQDATGGRAVPTFTGGAGGFVSTTVAQIPFVDTASTETTIQFGFDGTYWSFENAVTGKTIS